MMGLYCGCIALVHLDYTNSENCRKYNTLKLQRVLNTSVANTRNRIISSFAVLVFSIVGISYKYWGTLIYHRLLMCVSNKYWKKILWLCFHQSF